MTSNLSLCPKFDRKLSKITSTIFLRARYTNISALKQREIFRTLYVVCIKWKSLLVEEKSTIYKTTAQCTNFYNQGTAKVYIFHINRNEHRKCQTFRRRDVDEEDTCRIGYTFTQSHNFTRETFPNSC